MGTRERALKFFQDQVSAVLTPGMRAFIGRMEMAWIATSDSSGHCDCSFRSGPPGFVRVLSDGVVTYPDYRGNGVMASSGNLLDNPHIGMWFGDFDQELIGLHINGRAAVLLPEEMPSTPSSPKPSIPVGGRPIGWWSRSRKPTCTAVSIFLGWSVSR
jgi:predicted pyridoxine 5'-phosphate oxidase superfamily flavin-nucleotide-binding protein